MSLLPLIDRFPQCRVLVVGDVILDHYLHGDVSRTSPEAPVPILNVRSEEWLPGGAANVARNLVTAGATVDLVGMRGDDAHGRVLDDLLNAVPGLAAHFLVDVHRPTILKTRCVAQGQQMLRLDREQVAPATAEDYARAMGIIAERLAGAAGVILSDYGKGFLHPAFIADIIALARRHGVRVLVDPKGRDYARYRGASVLTPNQKEAAEATGVAIHDNLTCGEAAARLHDVVGGEAVVITRGPTGVSVFPAGGEPAHLPARARSVYDVTGAGDSFIAVMGLGLFAGGTLAQAAELGNLAGGFVVGLAGVATISADDLRALCRDPDGKRRKLLQIGELEQAVRSHRQHGAKMVFTNGFFDLLHFGHIRLLETARGMGDALIVAINSDAATRRLKGEPRPLLSADERAAILSSLPFVDYVIIFDDDTPEHLIRRLRPDVLVKGTAGGAPAEVVGADIVTAHGGQVRLVEIEGSTTTAAMLARLAAAEKKS